ncbi:MAG: hypothetical protein LBH98_05945, partial [Chitinispirillales bacterium]|nr:hypothetical protein [Chitinispirillales bacterium]
MFSYNQIIERLPISLRDYIRDNVEWVMILNNAVRRAVMQSRRFNTLSTSAPLPLNISTMPIIRSIEGETTFNKTYVYSFNEIVEWTNDIRNINNDYVADVNLIVIASSLAFDDITDFNNMKDKDLTAVYSTTTSNEFIVLKYERTYYPQSPRENPNPYHIYRKYYPYTRPQPKLHPLVGMRVFASKSTNNVINYYFTPQHTIDGIWNLDFIPPSSQFTVYYDSNNNLNVVLLNADRGTDYTNAFTAFIILQANNNVFGSLGVPVQRVETDKSLNEYYDFTEAQNITMSLYLPMGQPLVINITVRFFYLNMSIEYSPNLFEECLIDPILFNLVYYETKKSLYDFVEDTAAAQYQQKIIQEEIDREVKNVKITANTVQPAQIHNNDDIIDPKDRRSTNETIKDLKKQQAANILITNAIDILKKSG